MKLDTPTFARSKARTLVEQHSVQNCRRVEVEIRHRHVIGHSLAQA
jgi:hypothetical protein